MLLRTARPQNIILTTNNSYKKTLALTHFWFKMIFLYFLSFSYAQYYDTEYDYYNMTYDNYAYLNDSLNYDPYDSTYNPAYYDIYFDENSTDVDNGTSDVTETLESTEGWVSSADRDNHRDNLSQIKPLIPGICFFLPKS